MTKKRITPIGLQCTLVDGVLQRHVGCVVGETEDMLVLLTDAGELKSFPKDAVTLILNNRRVKGSTLAGGPWKRLKKGEMIIVD